MKKIAVIGVILCFLYFLIGAILVFFVKILGLNTYLTVSGFVGTLASVFGLISLGSPRVTNKDFEIFTSKKVKEIEEINTKINEIQGKLVITKGEIEQLKLQKEALALLIHKASEILFTKEQLNRDVDKIIHIIERNSELQELLNEIQLSQDTLKAYDEEIEVNPQLKTIMENFKEYKQRNLGSANISDIYTSIFDNLFSILFGKSNRRLR